MNREIEFRCWYDNQMHKVTDIDFRHRYIDLFAADSIEFGYGILMQYTGLKDKNGKKIFEGDIVRINEYYKGIGETDLLYKVEYVDRLYKFVFNPIIVNGKYDNNNHDVDLFSYEINDIEVIGNIYEDNLEKNRRLECEG